MNSPDMIMLAWILYKIGTEYGPLIFWNVMTSIFRFVFMVHGGIK